MIYSFSFKFNLKKTKKRKALHYETLSSNYLIINRTIFFQKRFTPLQQPAPQQVWRLARGMESMKRSSCQP